MPKKKKPITPENMQKMAVKIIKLLIEKDLFDMINIYAGGKHYTYDSYKNDPELREVKINNNNSYYVKDFDMNNIPVEYNNPETLTMTFEGPLYYELNYGNGKIHNEINKILDQYGLYSEMGYAWSLAAYE